MNPLVLAVGVALVVWGWGSGRYGLAPLTLRRCGHLHRADLAAWACARRRRLLPPRHAAAASIAAPLTPTIPAGTTLAHHIDRTTP